MKSSDSFQQESQKQSDYQKDQKVKIIQEQIVHNSTPAFCPECGHQTRKGADICENCGHWLLDGFCKFCYAPLDKEAAFCQECGNPVKGIPCPQCGKLSIFDFCPHCNIPLSQQAQQTINELKETLEEALVQHQKDHLENIPVKEEKQKEEKESYQFNWNNFLQRNLTKIKEKKKEADNKNPATANQANLHELIIAKALEEIQHQTFPNQQSARRHYSALKLLLPTISLVKIKKQITIGWRCYAYNFVHPQGPHECAEPQKGGEWLFETIEEEQEQTLYKEQDL